jgi:hypothetical protein
MYKQAGVRGYALLWIRSHPAGAVFANQELYRYLGTELPEATSLRGDADTEPRYYNDARWAVQDALHEKTIEHTGRRGEYRRLPD